MGARLVIAGSPLRSDYSSYTPAEGHECTANLWKGQTGSGKSFIAQLHLTDFYTLTVIMSRSLTSKIIY